MSTSPPAAAPDWSVPFAVFLSDPTVGIVFTGDDWLCDLGLQQLLGALPSPWSPLFVRASHDVAALNAAIPADTATSRGRVAVLRASPELEPEVLAVCRRAPAVIVIASQLDSLPRALEDRCALIVALGGPPGSQVPHAFEPLQPVPAPSDGSPGTDPLVACEPADLAVQRAAAAGLASHELEFRAAAVARAAARVGLEPASVLDEWVFGPRCAPQSPAPPPSPPPPEHNASSPSRGEGDGDGPESVDAPVPMPPPALRVEPNAGRARRALPGRRGPRAPHPSRGQPGRTLPWRRGDRPDIAATLAWALPRLPLRGWRPGEPIRLSPGDLRRRLRKSRSGRLQLIVLDASGSMARDAIRRAKGLALAELDRAYVERRSVAVIVARGRTAFIALPPTRSTRRVADCLRRLPAGGGTPLASAYLLAARLAARFDPASVDVLILTDGRANVPLKAGGDPQSDAELAAAVLRQRAALVRIQPIDPRRAVLASTETRYH